MKTKLSELIQHALLVASVAVTLASAGVAQSATSTSTTNSDSGTTENCPMPPHPGGPGHHHGPGDFLALLCAGQKLVGVTLPTAGTPPSDAVRAQIDAAIVACGGHVPPAPPAGSNSGSSSNATSND